VIWEKKAVGEDIVLLLPPLQELKRKFQEVAGKPFDPPKEKEKAEKAPKNYAASCAAHRYISLGNDRMASPVTIIKKRLIYATIAEGAIVEESSRRVYLCSDRTLIYEQFFADFGPLNIACVCRFVRQLAQLLEDPSHKGKLVVYHSSEHDHRRANSIFLICCFAMIRLKRTVIEAYAPFFDITPPLVPFRDAAFSTCTFPLTVLQVMKWSPPFLGNLLP
jgi:hypothetical protein